MEYYSAIKRNTFESVLMRWMNLEPIIQTEVRKRKLYILECEVKWALESITTNKASGGDGIPVELFKS